MFNAIVQPCVPIPDSPHPGGLGVDVELFDRHVARLTQLGYSITGAGRQLLWSLGRMLLHRADLNLNALTLDDVDELRQMINALSAWRPVTLQTDRRRCRTDRLAPSDSPLRIWAVIERYLRLHMDANLDRPQTVRHFRDALCRLVVWLRRIRRSSTSTSCTASMLNRQKFKHVVDANPPGESTT